MLLRDFENALEIRWVPVKMDRKNSNRARRNRGLDEIDIEAVRFVDVDENRLRAAMNHWLNRWKCSMRRYKNLIARFQAHCAVKQKCACRPRGTEHGLFCA